MIIITVNVPILRKRLTLVPWPDVKLATEITKQTTCKIITGEGRQAKLQTHKKAADM